MPIDPNLIGRARQRGEVPETPPQRGFVSFRRSETTRGAFFGQGRLGVGAPQKTVQVIPTSRAQFPSKTNPPPVVNFQVVQEAVTIEKANAEGQEVVNSVIRADPSKVDSDQLKRLTEAVKKRDIAQFQKVVKDDKDPGQLVNDLLVALNQADDIGSYDFVISKLEMIFPKIGDYVEKREEGRVLSTEGLQKVFDRIKKTRPWVVETMITKKGKEFLGKLREIQETDKDVEFGIIFYDGVHFRPFYICKREGGIEILCTDSLGSEEARTMGFSADDMLERFPGAMVHSLSTKRQFDDTNCPIFSLRDIVQISRYQLKGNDIFKYVQQHELEESQGRDRIFDSLPPALMKITQSMRKLGSYQESVELLKGKPGKRYLRDVSVKGERKLGNAYAQDKFAKYERFLIVAAIHEGIAVPA